MKPKAPRWLTESFRDGVDERYAVEVADIHDEQPLPCWCWLAQFDPAGKPCEGKLERFHFVRRQTVESALGALLPEAYELVLDALYLARPDELVPQRRIDWTDTIHAAAWDPRNGGIACEAHHRRLDSALVPLPSEQLIVPYEALPEHVLEFADDYGFEELLEAKYEKVPSDA